MCIYSYKYVCASAYKSRTRRCAGSLKGFSGIAFSRRICAIAITCRIRAGHRVSAIPISAIRVRLRSRFSTRTQFTFAIHDFAILAISHSRDPILAIRIRPHDHDSPHDSHSLFAFAITIRDSHSQLRLRSYSTRGYERVRTRGTRTKKNPDFLYYRVLI